MKKTKLFSFHTINERNLSSLFGGSFFKMEYIKKDGTTRLAVGKIVKDDRHELYTTYWDTVKKTYRRFNPHSVVFAENKRGRIESIALA